MRPWTLPGARSASFGSVAGLLGMRPDQDRTLVKCVSCRELYVPKEGDPPGCPHCGCPTWVSAWIGDTEARRPTARVAA